MSQESAFPKDASIPQQQLPCGAGAFAGKVLGLLDGAPKDEATVSDAFAGLDEMIDKIAAGLYSLASMLVGEGEESVQLVETAIATADISNRLDAGEARRSSRLALAKAAIEVLRRRDPQCLAAPEQVERAQGCIGDDDLDAAGVSPEELARMMSGPDRDRVRAWLSRLSTPARVIFALRAVAAFSSADVAGLLAQYGGPSAEGWHSDAVREVFRQALCSLASQLLHETTAG
jgi:DNA-directed RNA polymerase specialized sigma24 family protein